MTGACVYNTASGGYMAGYNVGIMEDCCGDRSQAQHDRMIASYGGYQFDILNLKTLKTMK